MLTPSSPISVRSRPSSPGLSSMMTVIVAKRFELPCLPGIRATPAANAEVASPKSLSLTFSEKLEPKFSGFELMKADGKPVALKASVAAKDHKTLSAAPSAPLAPGGYMVMWHVVSADGHRMKGDFSFTVH